MKKLLLQQARKVYWKKCAAKHDFEELKEGIWLEPALALLRKKTKKDCAEKHRKVAEKCLEGGWVQLVEDEEDKKGRTTEADRETKEEMEIGSGRRLGCRKRLFDIGWPDECKCQACHKEEGTEKHRLHHCREWCEIRREIPEALRKWEQQTITSKKEWKWQKRYRRAPSK